MTNKKWIAFDIGQWDFKFCATEAEARAEAERMLKVYADLAPDEGWPEDTCIGVAKIMMLTVEHEIANKKDFTDEDWDEEGYDLDIDRYIDYTLEEVNEQAVPDPAIDTADEVHAPEVTE